MHYAEAELRTCLLDPSTYIVTSPYGCVGYVEVFAEYLVNLGFQQYGIVLVLIFTSLVRPAAFVIVDNVCILWNLWNAYAHSLSVVSSHGLIQ